MPEQVDFIYVVIPFGLVLIALAWLAYRQFRLERSHGAETPTIENVVIDGFLSVVERIADIFVVKGMPHASRAFLFLTLLFTALFVWTTIVIGESAMTNSAMFEANLFVKDTLKIVVGAFVGSLAARPSNIEENVN